MSEPDRVPLAQPHDRGQGVELHHQPTTGAQPCGTLAQRGPLVDGVHHGETAVHHEISGLAGAGDATDEAGLAQLRQPASTVGAVVFGDGGSGRDQA